MQHAGRLNNFFRKKNKAEIQSYIANTSTHPNHHKLVHVLGFFLRKLDKHSWRPQHDSVRHNLSF